VAAPRVPRFVRSGEYPPAHHNQDEAGWTERRQAPVAPTPDGIETSRALSSPRPGNLLTGSQGPDLEPPQ